MAVSYAIVTAAYNEAKIIENTLRSVAAQTIQPEAWVVVSDGSTDETDGIVRRHAARLPCMQVIRIDRDPGRTFVSKVHAVRAGFARLAALRCDFVGNLDADLSFASTYFEQLLGKFAADPRLGVGGGWIHEHGPAGFKGRASTTRACGCHAVQLMRRDCYEAVGGYVPLPYGGEDTCAVVKARMVGWNAESFPDLCVQHHRRTASAGGVLRNRFRVGMMDHSLGYHPAYELMKGARRLAERPVRSWQCRQPGGFRDRHASPPPEAGVGRVRGLYPTRTDETPLVNVQALHQRPCCGLTAPLAGDAK